MNIVIKDSKYTQRDLDLIFNSRDIVFAAAITLDQLCKELDIYKSTSEARRAGRIGNIPIGYSEIKASKLHTLYIWNPDH